MAEELKANAISEAQQNFKETTKRIPLILLLRYTNCETMCVSAECSANEKYKERKKALKRRRPCRFIEPGRDFGFEGSVTWREMIG